MQLISHPDPLALSKPSHTGARALATRLLRFIGPATMVGVGYMDPGNWATDLEGGARFGYRLLWVLLVANAMALLLQTLSARLGIVTGLDLARACRAYYPRRVSVALWLLAEIGIVACDLAEVLGSAIALNLLFRIPMAAGAALTVLDAFLILGLQRRGARTLDAVVLTLVVTIAVCLGIDLVLAHPAPADVVGGLAPRLPVGSLAIVIGMVGATVMPHNLYLQSSLVRGRAGESAARIRRSIASNTLATGLALTGALFVNVALLLVSASAFGAHDVIVDDLREAYSLLAPTVGAAAASVLFAVALLCSGQSATITGTMAGQIVMEGFVDLHLSPFLRRLVTRGLATVPAVVVLVAVGDEGVMPMLLVSQVVLSLQLPFAVVPLLRLTRDPRVMTAHATSTRTNGAAWVVAGLVVGANAALLWSLVRDVQATSPLAAATIAILGVACLGFVVYLACARGDASVFASDARARQRDRRIALLANEL